MEESVVVKLASLVAIIVSICIGERQYYLSFMRFVTSYVQQKPSVLLCVSVLDCQTSILKTLLPGIMCNTSAVVMTMKVFIVS